MKFEFSNQTRNNLRKMLQARASAYNFYRSRSQFDRANEELLRLGGMLEAVSLILNGRDNQAELILGRDGREIVRICYRIDERKSVELAVKRYKPGGTEITERA